jgi:CubicO group peptidase (beta-lactamase class C family)
VEAHLQAGLAVAAVGVALAMAWTATGAASSQPRGDAAVDAVVAAGWPEVQALHAGLVTQAGIAGSSLAFVANGRVVGRSDQGVQDLARQRPVDGRTIYHWASITKTLTGIAIMQLRDRGRLTLDDPVVAHLPEIRAIHNPYGDISQVTIAHLLSHSAGLRASTWPWGGSEPWQPFEPTRWEQLVAMMPYTQLQFAPGSRYSYSNPGVILLGRIIEQLAGEDFEVYVTKNLLMPLGMRDAFFDRAPYHLLPHRSRSYYRDPSGVREARFDFDTGITVSNGGLNAPVADMARYLAFLAGAEPGSVEDGVLARTSLEEMFTPRIAARDGEGGSGQDVRMGLSFFVERHAGLEFVAHSGQQNGFVSHFYLHRPTRSAYIVAFNTEVRSGDTPSREVTREVDAQLRDAIVARVFVPLAAAAK